MLSPPPARRVRSGNCVDLKSGKINIVISRGDKKERLQMYMKVIANNYEHHAQLYTDSNYCLQFGCLSLRNCVVTMMRDHTNGIHVSVESKPGIRRQGVVFEAASKGETEQWIKALTPKVSLLSIPDRSVCHSPIMIRSVLDALTKIKLSLSDDDFDDDFNK